MGNKVEWEHFLLPFLIIYKKFHKLLGTFIVLHLYKSQNMRYNISVALLRLCFVAPLGVLQVIYAKICLNFIF